ncbi:hypothetical protein BSP38_198 [Bacillus phage BSP38]|uniref:Uncharacterized protein n=1 Tax=Bacillus phage BSP38 TaxID=2283013 RepID=A0A345MK58_BPBSP|nr:hypothetical protein HWB82_gp120 [Bacillus phage BSP38]AXH71240.1 hypothetical protein BSP38_198 [Bacillus phage BSP38]
MEENLEQRLEELVFDMVSELNQLEGKSLTYLLRNFKYINGLSVSVSVYKDQKPAHRVLGELVQWARDNGKTELLDLIKELEDDMSWNEEHPLEDRR